VPLDGLGIIAWVMAQSVCWFCKLVNMRSLYLCVLMATLLPAGLWGQVNVVVKSAATRQPLPYATVAHPASGWAAVADEKGQLYIPPGVSTLPDKKLRISYTGYVTLDTLLTLPFQVVLQPLPETLKPVSVKPCGSAEVATTSNFQRSRPDFYLGSATTETNLSSWAAYMPNPDGRRGWLQELDFWVDNLAAPKEVMKAPFRLRFLEWDTATQLPGQPLVWQEVMVFPKGKEQVTAALDSLHIPWPAEGMVIAIDFFDAGPAYHYTARTTLRLPDGRDTVRNTDRYGPSIRATTYAQGQQGFYFGFKTNRWHPFFFGNKPAAPMMRLQLKTCR
jgi:hypothetical protein